MFFNGFTVTAFGFTAKDGFLEEELPASSSLIKKSVTRQAYCSIQTTLIQTPLQP
ncbi:hypothetical protein IEQ34_000862 [Dendrobium chrysotoxum]|uniref:Uncharacterized protein n=1 Tax=Dendrobium chrysotoxum TaxID=161865 RepID=A0AAV7HTK5_DENCH|nr:hypothetical protein IEQ34_000862 [Dendrobium chrysotoxum]